MRRIGLIIVGLALGCFFEAPAFSADATSVVQTSTAAAHSSGLNELKGTFQSKNNDPMTIRITTDGGYNVEFTYDAKTKMINGGNPITADDLSYGDMLVIHYSGKELYAIDIDRLSKAATTP